MLYRNTIVYFFYNMALHWCDAKISFQFYSVDVFNCRMFSPYMNVLIAILFANSDQDKYLSIATISDAMQWETLLNQSSYIFHIL